VGEQVSDGILDGFTLFTVHPQPGDAVDHRRAGAAGETGDHRLHAGAGFQINEPEALRVAADVAIGHGEQVARVVPARQILHADVAKQVHALEHVALARQPLQILVILADPDQRVVDVQPARHEARQGPHHLVEALAALQPPDGENEALAITEPNAGEKVVFWGGVIVLGLTVVASGLVLDKLVPGMQYTRGQMQIAHMIHAVASFLMMAMFVGHIYMGTIGVKGSLQAMRTGYVDEAWAQEHHGYWYDDIKAGRVAAIRSGVSAPEVGTAPRAQT